MRAGEIQKLTTYIPAVTVNHIEVFSAKPSMATLNTPNLIGPLI